MATTRSPRKKDASEAPINFEDALNQLNTLIEKMESDKLSLNDALSAFEQGVGLIKQCQQSLTAAEQKIEKIIAAKED